MASNMPANLSLVLGATTTLDLQRLEFPVQVADLNVFNSSLSIKRMIGMTSPGDEECGAPGDILNWEEVEWTLYSEAKVVKVDREWEGPCRKKSKLQLFKANFERHDICMNHCQKIARGRSPPVNTAEQWEEILKEVKLITPNRLALWLSATEGDKNKKLKTLPHWHEKEEVNNKTVTLKAEETVWRDFYTGLRLDNTTKSFIDYSGEFGDTKHCMKGEIQGTSQGIGDILSGFMPLRMMGTEFECSDFDENILRWTSLSCACRFEAQPLLSLRGLRKSSLIAQNSASEIKLFTPRQLSGGDKDIALLGQWSTRIEYNQTSSQWVLTESKHNVTAVSGASKASYALGKHRWTISGDAFECSQEKPYTTMLKLTGCDPESEFTCDDGQCISMERRCDQVTGSEPNCRDESDEEGCQMIVLKKNYNKRIPPVVSGRSGVVIPVKVSIAINLMKVVEIEETDHSIQLQFGIKMTWKENRVQYRNLKTETSLNVLSEEDFNRIWLPLIVYDNTDQKETTRLGENWEWMTMVTVTREGEFVRSGVEDVEEVEIFEGSENRLNMGQTYTWGFQCKYLLQRYPFDAQVNLSLYDHV